MYMHFQKTERNGHIKKVKADPVHYLRNKTSVPVFSEKVLLDTIRELYPELKCNLKLEFLTQTNPQSSKLFCIYSMYE